VKSLQEVEDEEVVRRRLLQVKELQKLRSRSKGVNAGVHADLNLPPTDPLLEEKSSRLDSNFTTQNDAPEVNHYQEKYVEEMMKKRAIEGTEETDQEKEKKKEAPPPPFPGSDADLYTTPDHLKPQVKQTTGETTNWLTGIVEVQLPVEYKLKNIEETERAKRELLNNQAQPVTRSTFGEANLYGSSFGSIRYQTDKETKRAASSSSSSSSSSAISGNERATDDIVMERFKKRFRK